MKSWKTTVVGVVSFIVAGCVAKGWITADQAAALSAVIIGLLGVLAKDFNITGGS